MSSTPESRNNDAKEATPATAITHVKFRGCAVQSLHTHSQGALLLNLSFQSNILTFCSRKALKRGLLKSRKHASAAAMIHHLITNASWGVRGRLALLHVATVQYG